MKEKTISPMKARMEATWTVESLSPGFPAQLSIIQTRQAAGCAGGDAMASVHVGCRRSGWLSSEQPASWGEYLQLFYKHDKKKDGFFMSSAH